MAEKQERIFDLLDNLYNSCIDHALKEDLKIFEYCKEIR